MSLAPGPTTTFIVPGDTADVRAVAEVIMALTADGTDRARWLVRGTDGALWVLVRSEAMPEIPFEGKRLPDRP